MKINAAVVCQKLAPLRYGVPASPTLQQSECVIFQSGKAYTFSGDLFAITDCDLGFEGAVDYKALIDVFSKYGDAEVDVVLSSENALTVKRGRSRTNLSYADAIWLSIQAVASPDSAGWKPLPGEFSSSVLVCESVVQNNRADEILSSINVTPSFMEAASSSQIIRHKCLLDIPNRFLVRGGLLGKLLAAEITEYQIVQQWLFFRSPSVTFAMPVYADDFIEGMDEYLKPADYQVEFPSELKNDMPLIQSVVGKNGLMTVAMEGGRCTLSANGTKGSHQVDADMATPIDLTFRISPSLFQRILTEFPSCTLSKNGVRVQNNDYSYAASVEGEE